MGEVETTPRAAWRDNSCLGGPEVARVLRQDICVFLGQIIFVFVVAIRCYMRQDRRGRQVARELVVRG